MTVDLKAEIEIPSVPNFLSSGMGLRDRLTIPIGVFTDDQLRAVAKQWTESLLANAAKQRREAQIAKDAK